MSQLFLPTQNGYTADRLRFDGYHLYAGERIEFPWIVAVEPGTSFSTISLLTRGQVVPEAPGVEWILFVDRGRHLLLNGERIDLGIAPLHHRDELRIDACAPIYFSNERIVAVEPFLLSGSPRCPRCAQSLARGELAVRCPSCSVFHHQLADRPCWTYSPHCALCDQPSDLAAELRWTPEGL